MTTVGGQTPEKALDAEDLEVDEKCLLAFGLGRVRAAVCDWLLLWHLWEARERHGHLLELLELGRSVH